MGEDQCYVKHPELFKDFKGKGDSKQQKEEKDNGEGDQNRLWIKEHRRKKTRMRLIKSKMVL